MYLKVTPDGVVYPYTFYDLRRDHPNVSFSTHPTPEDLEPFNVFQVEPVAAPEPGYREVVEEVEPELIEGVYRQAWSIRDMTPQEIDDALPKEVTNRQARLALLAARLLDDAEAMIAAIPDSDERKAAQIEWERGSTIRRDHPLIATIGNALGLSEAAIDSLFEMAAEL